MFVSTFLGVLFSVLALSTLVAGDPGSIITLKSVKMTNTPSEYFETWSVEAIKGRRSSMLNAKMPVKKEVPGEMQFKIVLNMKDQDPIEYESTVCDVLTEPTVGKSFVDAGTPAGEFPRDCPFGPGDWGISKWDPPVSVIPPGIPDGPIWGTVVFQEEGKEPYIQVDYEGELSHGFMGR